MVPVALALLPLACDVCWLEALPGGRPALRRPDQPETALPIARQHRFDRVAKTIAITRLRQRQLRLHRVEKRRARRGLAAMVRHEQKVGFQTGRVSARSQTALLVGDIESPQE